ncbi:MAG: hypothetical protein LBE65_04615 [Synergistaceae bacterium]|nr:hypothetical protein [Synergistaceae bacterium]
MTAVCLVIALSILAASRASAADRCGVVEKLTPTVTATREGRRIELSEGDAVYIGDVITAGSSGYVETRLIDDTLMAFGDSSVVVLNDVRFRVGVSRLDILLINGVLWVSIGSIGLVSADAVQLNTPSMLVSSGNATIQIEAGKDGEKLQVQWLNKGGKVEVYNKRTEEWFTLRESAIAVDNPNKHRYDRFPDRK